MNRKEVENKINESFSRAAPNVADSVLSDCVTQERAIFGSAAKKGTSVFWKIAALSLAVVLIAVSVVWTVGYAQTNAQAAAVSLDVNPSVEIQLNKKQRVVSVTALNADGKVIIGDMDFAGADLKVAVNALIGSMLRNGYLSDYANSVLVSVESDKNNYKSIAETVADEITFRLQETQIKASVVSQWVQSNDVVSATAKQYGISVGKAQLINKIVTLNNAYSTEQLAALSVNELNLIMSGLDVSLNDVTQSGSASEKSYVGADFAKQKALDDLHTDGLTADSGAVKFTDCKLDYDDGVMVYEIEFIYGNYAYSYEIGAISGNILSSQLEYLKMGGAGGVKLTQEQILQTAYFKANVKNTESAENLFFQKCRFYRNETYTVSFNYEGRYFEYEIDCYGNVLYSKNEVIAVSEEDGYLSRRDLDKWFCENNTDGFTQLDKLNRYRVTTSKTEEGLVYEISFVCGESQFTYKVDAVNRTIVDKQVSQYSNVVKDNIRDALFEMGFGDDLDSVFDIFGDWDWNDWDWDDEMEFEFDNGENRYEFEADRWGNIISFEQKPNAPFGREPYISEEQAKQIVFRRAGVSDESDVDDFSIELERDFRFEYYNIEFVYNNREFEYKVNPLTGEIMKDLSFDEDRREPHFGR